MKVELKSITPNAETNIVEIARVSSSRTNKSEAPEGLINYLIKNKHWSPFQHSYLTFEIVTSKAIAIQFLRHLSFTFQEFSQRYARVTAFEDIEFRLQAEKNRQSSTDVVGKLVIGEEGWEFIGDHDHETYKYFIEAGDLLVRIQELYNKMIDGGVAKECARFILPMTTQTTLYMTGSVRSWIHFIQLRDDGHAQKEAQLIAREIKAIFNKELPIISKALEWKNQ
tara:strand:- start:44 stop:718 length:675 start_codon:yes stop_codon:yes gene_type:complete